MFKFSAKDFVMLFIDKNGVFVRISELNKMVECGAISIDIDKFNRYKQDTMVRNLKNEESGVIKE